MLKSAPVRYTIYGTLLIVLSEVVYHSCRLLKNWYNCNKNIRKPKELWALRLTNELSGLCSAKHETNFRKLSAISLNSREALDKIKIIERAPVCANPYCMDSNVDLIVDLLNATQYSIDLAMFAITLIPISNALVKAHKRGVIIRIIANNGDAMSISSECRYLIKYGIAIRFNSHITGKHLMHHKFCILDSPLTVKHFFGKKNILTNNISEYINNMSSILMTGSANWTIQGFRSNYENILLTNQEQLIENYSNEFQRMWKLFGPSL